MANNAHFSRGSSSIRGETPRGGLLDFSNWRTGKLVHNGREFSSYLKHGSRFAEPGIHVKLHLDIRQSNHSNGALNRVKCVICTEIDCAISHEAPAQPVQSAQATRAEHYTAAWCCALTTITSYHVLIPSQPPPPADTTAQSVVNACGR